jgi:hypothetical protein
VTPWYRDRATLALIVKRYLPLLAALNLVWEIAQLPLYTLWRDGSAGYIAFAVVHCTAGDVLIGAAALALALMATRAGPLASWRWREVGLATAALGVLYTAASEWMNTSLRPAWQYSILMPTLTLGEIRIGLSPLAQWLVLPALSLFVSRRRAAH